MELSLKDAIEIYQSQYSLVDSIWAYYATVTLAVLGYTIGSDRPTQKLLEFRAIQSAYFLFSLGNLIALIFAQSDLIRISKYIDTLGSGISFSPVGLEPMVVFHVFVTVSVIFALSLIYRARQSRRANG